MVRTMRTRPHWHVDAKWLSALLLLPLLVATLGTFGIYRITEEDVAVPALSLGLAAVTAGDGGLDSRKGVAELRKGIPQLGVTKRELEGLTPREARIHIWGKLARPFYHGGVDAVAPLLRLTPKQLERARRDSALLRVFTRPTHERLGGIVLGLAAASLVVAALLLYFSAGFGRVAGPGLVLLLAGIPGLVLSAVIKSNEDARSGAGYVVSELSPLVLEPLRFQYVAVLGLGAGLLAVAGLGKLGRRLAPAWATTR